MKVELLYREHCCNGFHTAFSISVNESIGAVENTVVMGFRARVIDHI